MFTEILNVVAFLLLFIGIGGGVSTVLIDRNEWRKWRPSGRSMFLCVMLGVVFFIIVMVLKVQTL